MSDHPDSVESDISEDTLDSALDLAREVLEDYGLWDGTRIARLARWMIINLGGPSLHDVELVLLGDDIPLRIRTSKSVYRNSDEARARAISLLAAAERAELLDG